MKTWQSSELSMNCSKLQFVECEQYLHSYGIGDTILDFVFFSPGGQEARTRPHRLLKKSKMKRPRQQVDSMSKLQKRRRRSKRSLCIGGNGLCLRCSKVHHLPAPRVHRIGQRRRESSQERALHRSLSRRTPRRHPSLPLPARLRRPPRVQDLRLRVCGFRSPALSKLLPRAKPMLTRPSRSVSSKLPVSVFL